MDRPDIVSTSANTVAKESRQYPRKNIRLEVRCQILRRGVVTEPEIQETVDLGTRGAGILSKVGMDVGGMLMLTLYLPPLAILKNQRSEALIPAKDCQSVAVLSRVIWNEPEGAGYRYGVQFLDLERDHRQRFKRFLVDLGLDQLSSPWYT